MSVGSDVNGVNFPIKSISPASEGLKSRQIPCVVSEKRWLPTVSGE